MTPLSLVLPAPPVAAIETGLFLFAFPLILMLGIWAVITAVRILYPEAPLPLDRTSRARRRGEAAPVRLREIVAEQRRRPAPAFPPAVAAAEAEPEARAAALTEALWARRN